MSDELNSKRRELGGSGKAVDLIEDTNSIVVDEVVDQLNASRIPVQGLRVGGASGSAYRVPLLAADRDMWIRNASFTARGAIADTLVNAASYLALKAALDGAQDFETPLLTGARTLFQATDFSGGATFPGASTKNTEQFDEGTLSNTIAGNPKGMILKAGEVLYFEFNNVEGADRFFDVYAQLAPVDRINTQPGSGRGLARRGLSELPLRQQREFLVTERGQE